MTGSPEEPQAEPSETALKRCSPVVGHRLDVGQQVHLEGVALLEGLPALRESGGVSPPGFVPPSPPRTPAAPNPPYHTCGAFRSCASSCAG